MKFAQAAVAAATALALTGCGLLGGTPASDAVSVAIGQPGSLLPAAVGDEHGSQVLAALFTPLVDFDAQRRPVPKAAAAVTSADSRVWRIGLAGGYSFHNGEPVTADNYLAAWNHAAYGPHARRNAFLFDRFDGFADVQGDRPRSRALSGLKKVDDRTFEVTLTAPFADFPAMLGHPAFSPLPKAAFAAGGALDPAYELAPVGQGPYRMTGRWDRGGAITLERYAAHPTKPPIGRLEFRVYERSADAYDDLRSGTLDVDPTIPETQLGDARARLGARLVTAPTATVNFLAVPDFEPDYADPRVRRAISMAIDRNALVETHFPGSQVPARGFVPATVPGHRPDGCGAPCGFDPTAARAAYREAGGPATLTIAYNADGGHRGWVTALCDQLARNLGVGCTATARPRFDLLLADVRALKPLGMFRMTWTMDYPSMESYLAPLFSAGGSSNYARYRNTEFDSLLREAGAARTAADAVPIYQRAEDMLAKDLPLIPVRAGQRWIGHSSRVSGVHLDAFDRINLTALTLP